MSSLKQKPSKGNINTSGLSKKKINHMEVVAAFNRAKKSNKKK